KIFKILLSLFVVFGFIAFMGMYETTPIQMIESQITGRTPASVAAATSVKSTEVLKIDCSEFNQEIHVPAHHVRLEGYLCNKVPDASKVYLKNETTGKSATLFNRGMIRYMTDFIQLVEGKNNISLSFVLKDKSTKRVDLTLIR